MLIRFQASEAGSVLSAPSIQNHVARILQQFVLQRATSTDGALNNKKGIILIPFEAVHESSDKYYDVFLAFYYEDGVIINSSAVTRWGSCSISSTLHGGTKGFGWNRTSCATKVMSVHEATMKFREKAGRGYHFARHDANGINQASMDVSPIMLDMTHQSIDNFEKVATNLADKYGIGQARTHYCNSAQVSLADLLWGALPNKECLIALGLAANNIVMNPDLMITRLIQEKENDKYAVIFRHLVDQCNNVVFWGISANSTDSYSILKRYKSAINLPSSMEWPTFNKGVEETLDYLNKFRSLKIAYGFEERESQFVGMF